jgi:GNAT superfamily N-acetyltransferase
VVRPRVDVRPIRPGDWPALETLFGERGACGGCWCMAWRLRQAEWERRRGARNRAAFRRLVLAARAPGILAFEGARAVGWCSVAPRADFDGLVAKRSLATDWDEGTWSVTCFFLTKEWRGRGLGTRLLRAAVALARTSGATRLEGYPAAPPRAGGPLPAAFAWTGLPSMYEACGFRALDETPGKRPIYVRRFRRRRSTLARRR